MDEGRRRLERKSRAEPGDRATRQGVLKADVRVGRLHPQSVRLAALLGDEDAVVVSGVAADPALSFGFQTAESMQFWVDALTRACAYREPLPRDRVYARGADEVRVVVPGVWLAAVEVADGVSLMERPDLDIRHLQDEVADLRRMLRDLREDALFVVDGGRPDRDLANRLLLESDRLFERVSTSMIVPGMEALPEAAAVVVTVVNIFQTPKQTTTGPRMLQGLFESAVRVISLGDTPSTARMGDWHDLSRRVRDRMIHALLRRHTGGVRRLPTRRNSDAPLVPFGRTDDNLPAIPTTTLPRHEWRPPRVSFDLMLSGKAPFTYLPEGAYEHQPLTAALGRLLTRQGIADVNAWEDLLAQCGSTRAKLYVVDRAGERYQVVGVEFDFGGDTGQLLVRHLGPKSRGGDFRVDIHQAFGKMLPVVVYSPAQRNSDEDLRALERQADAGDRSAFLSFLRGLERTGRPISADLMPAIEFFYDNDLSDPLPGTGRSMHAIALAEAEKTANERGWRASVDRDDYYNDQRDRTAFMHGMKEDEMAVEVSLIDPTPTGPGDGGSILDSATPIFIDRDESFESEPDDFDGFPPDVRVAFAYMALKALKAEQ